MLTVLEIDVRRTVEVATVAELLPALGLAESRGTARRFAAQHAVGFNGVTFEGDPDEPLTLSGHVVINVGLRGRTDIVVLGSPTSHPSTNRSDLRGRIRRKLSLRHHQRQLRDV